MKLFRKIFKKEKIQETKKEKVNKHSPVRDLMASGEDLKLLMELTIGSNVLFDQEWPKLSKIPFQEVHDILAHHKENDVFGMIEILTKKNNQEILELESGFFIKFVKWMDEEVKTIYKLYEALASKEEIGKEEVAYKNAGSEILNKYNEKMIYYSIDKNPAKWPEMEKVLFEVMFTKLLIDRDLATVNKRYNELMSK